MDLGKTCRLLYNLLFIMKALLILNLLDINGSNSKIENSGNNKVEMVQYKERIFIDVAYYSEGLV